jgi:hypothetical protein
LQGARCGARVRLDRYVFGSSSVKSNPLRIETQLVGDEMHGTFPNGARVVYRFRPDGHLDFLFLPKNGGQVMGVLSKEQ